ncbi:MAG: hypothetical protein FWD57_12840 [Polyangiaceae bacterium]|nr:hypothetical protein [Polyangiaceae bacterium]
MVAESLNDALDLRLMVHLGTHSWACVILGLLDAHLDVAPANVRWVASFWELSDRSEAADDACRAGWVSVV